jgi:hypothetical protein
MNQIYPDTALAALANRISAGTIYYRLFTNNLTLSLDTVIGDFTEAGWTGYNAAGVSLYEWTLNFTVGHVYTQIAAARSFLYSSGAPVSAYGYYMTDAGLTEFLGCARFDGAPITKADGESFTVLPILSDFSRFSA